MTLFDATSHANGAHVTSTVVHCNCPSGDVDIDVRSRDSPLREGVISFLSPHLPLFRTRFFRHSLLIADNLTFQTRTSSGHEDNTPQLSTVRVDTWRMYGVCMYNIITHLGRLTFLQGCTSMVSSKES